MLKKMLLLLLNFPLPMKPLQLSHPLKGQPRHPKLKMLVKVRQFLHHLPKMKARPLLNMNKLHQ